METITDQLNSLVASVSLINEAKRKGILSSLLSSFDFEPKSKSESQLKEALDWFVDGGLFTSYWKESVPYGERKNSKKKRKTTWFWAKKKGIKFLLGHVTVKNYDPSFWEIGAEELVKSAICREGGFCAQNGSFINYVKSKGVDFKDEGQKN